MGWFDEQIRQRKQNDDRCFCRGSFVDMASAVIGKQKCHSRFQGFSESAVTL